VYYPGWLAGKPARGSSTGPGPTFIGWTHLDGWRRWTPARPLRTCLTGRAALRCRHSL